MIRFLAVVCSVVLIVFVVNGMSQAKAPVIDTPYLNVPNELEVPAVWVVVPNEPYLELKTTDLGLRGPSVFPLPKRPRPCNQNLVGKGKVVGRVVKAVVGPVRRVGGAVARPVGKAVGVVARPVRSVGKAVAGVVGAVGKVLGYEQRQVRREARKGG